jgi:hypothetical protein
MNQLPNSARRSRKTELCPSEEILVMLNLNQFLATANVLKAKRPSTNSLRVTRLPLAAARLIDSARLRRIQEGLRGVVRHRDGTAHSPDSPDFPVPVMGKICIAPGIPQVYPANYKRCALNLIAEIRAQLAQ